MKNTEELKQEVINRLDAVKQELLNKIEKSSKSKFEVGKWYKSTYGSLFFPVSFNKNVLGTVFFNVYGIDCDGNWVDINDNPRHFNNSYPATHSEVQQALEAEAIKRGFKEGVTVDKSSMDYFYYQKIWKLYSNKINYNIDDDELKMGSDLIYMKGKWATIILQEKTSEEWVKEYELGYECLLDFIRNNNLKITNK